MTFFFFQGAYELRPGLNFPAARNFAAASIWAIRRVNLRLVRWLRRNDFVAARFWERISRIDDTNDSPYPERHGNQGGTRLCHLHAGRRSGGHEPTDRGLLRQEFFARFWLPAIPCQERNLNASLHSKMF